MKLLKYLLMLLPLTIFGAGNAFAAPAKSSAADMLAATAAAEKSSGRMGGIMYGENYAFMITAPDGWVLDNEAGKQDGLDAVFYPDGESWQEAETVMYVNTASLDNNKDYSTLDQFMKYDSENFANARVVKGDDIKIGKDEIAKVKYFTYLSKNHENFEAVAYLQHEQKEQADVAKGRTAIMFVMSSRSREGFEASKPAFQSLVKSYIPMAKTKGD